MHQTGAWLKSAVFVHLIKLKIDQILFSNSFKLLNVLSRGCHNRIYSRVYFEVIKFISR